MVVQHKIRCNYLKHKKDLHVTILSNDATLASLDKYGGIVNTNTSVKHDMNDLLINLDVAVLRKEDLNIAKKLCFLHVRGK